MTELTPREGLLLVLTAGDGAASDATPAGSALASLGRERARLSLCADALQCGGTPYQCGFARGLRALLHERLMLNVPDDEAEAAFATAVAAYLWLPVGGAGASPQPPQRSTSPLVAPPRAAAPAPAPAGGRRASVPVPAPLAQPVFTLPAAMRSALSGGY